MCSPGVWGCCGRVRRQGSLRRSRVSPTSDTLPLKQIDSTKGPKKANSGQVSVNLSMNAILYQLAASANDQPIDQTSNNFREINYGMDVYYKSAAMLQWLEDYMGDEAFEAGMHEYYDTWKHKHPYPEDFKAIMQRHEQANRLVL